MNYDVPLEHFWKMQTMKFIDLSVQQEAIREELDARIAAVLAHGQYIMGPEINELETVLRKFVGVRHCTTVSSGTDALLISLMALGIGPGDEVITTPFTFISTVEVIVLLGATPVFVDVENDTALLNASLVEEKITNKTKAIVPVSLYGQIPDMVEINRIAQRCGEIPVIEDAAQSFGAMANGNRSCGVSTIGCTSFFPSKPFGCYGDGGAIFTNDDSIAERVNAIRAHGQTKRYVHDRVGLCGRLDTLQAAILLAKWPRFSWELVQRKRVAQNYYRKLTGPLRTMRLMTVRKTHQSVFGQFTLTVENRDHVRNYLNKFGIPTAVHYPKAINRQPGYLKNLGMQPTPVADWFSQHVLSVPMGPDLTIVDQLQIIEKLIEVDSHSLKESESSRLAA